MKVRDIKASLEGLKGGSFRAIDGKLKAGYKSQEKTPNGGLEK